MIFSYQRGIRIVILNGFYDIPVYNCIVPHQNKYCLRINGEVTRSVRIRCKKDPPVTSTYSGSSSGSASSSSGSSSGSSGSGSSSSAGLISIGYPDDKKDDDGSDVVVIVVCAVAVVLTLGWAFMAYPKKGGAKKSDANKADAGVGAETAGDVKVDVDKGDETGDMDK